MEDIFARGFLKRAEAAAYLGLKPSSLAADICTKRLRVPHYKVGAKIFYRRDELDQWLAQRRVGGTGQCSGCSHES